MQLKTLFRRIVSAIMLPFLVILYLNIEKWAEANGWDSILKQSMEGNMPAVASFLLQPWLGYIAFGTVFFHVGRMG